MAVKRGYTFHRNFKQQCIYCGRDVWTRSKDTLAVCSNWGCQSQDEHAKYQRTVEVARVRKQKKRRAHLRSKLGRRGVKR